MAIDLGAMDIVAARAARSGIRAHRARGPADRVPAQHRRVASRAPPRQGHRLAFRDRRRPGHAARGRRHGRGDQGVAGDLGCGRRSDSVRNAPQLHHQRSVLDPAAARRHPRNAAERGPLALCGRSRDDAADQPGLSGLCRPHPRTLRFLSGQGGEPLPGATAAAFPAASHLDRHIPGLVAPRLRLVAARAAQTRLHFPVRTRAARLCDHRRRRRGIVGSLERGPALEANGRASAGRTRSNCNRVPADGWRLRQEVALE